MRRYAAAETKAETNKRLQRLNGRQRNKLNIKEIDVRDVRRHNERLFTAGGGGVAV